MFDSVFIQTQINRHRDLNSEIVNTLHPTHGLDWGVIETSMAENRLQLRGCCFSKKINFTIVGAIFNIQNFNDVLLRSSSGSEREVLQSAGQHFSILMKASCKNLMNCGAEETEAEKILLAVNSSYQRVLSGHSSEMELLEFQRELSTIGCGREAKAA